MAPSLPPGQFATAVFERFGLGRFAAYRLPADAPFAIDVRGDVGWASGSA